MLKKILTLSVVATTAFFAQPAQAHFQLVYTPEINVDKGGNLPLKLIFWHPMENGHAMEMKKPLEFYSVFKGEKEDLSSSLKAIKFKGLTNEADAFDGSLKLNETVIMLLLSCQLLIMKKVKISISSKSPKPLSTKVKCLQTGPNRWA